MATLDVKTMFQFQTGSIRRTLDMVLKMLTVVFQFQTGSIRSLSNSRWHDRFT